MDISLQRISLGALIIALGLLVDDAMITIEMMISKIEEGMEKVKAATFAYTSTAFPMLTGTLVTIFGFLPIGFADNNTGQYCFSLFAVIAVALVASWFVAVIFAPVIGLTVLPSRMKAHSAAEPGRFMRAFGRMLGFGMRHRWLTIAASLVAFGASVYGLGFVQQQFFPASNRPELLVTMTLPKNASIAATEAETERLEKVLAGDPDISRFSSYVGGGAIRFYLPLDVQLDNDFMAETVVVAKDLEARDRVQAKLETLFADELPRRDGPHLAAGARAARRLARAVPGKRADDRRGEALCRAGRECPAVSGLVRNVNYDWAEKNKELRIVVDQDRVRQAGLSSEQLAQALNRVISGSTVTQSARLDLSRRRRGAGRERRAVEHRSLDAISRSRRRRAPRCRCASSRRSSTSSTRVTSGAAAACPPSPSRRSRCPGLEPASVNQRIAGCARDRAQASMPAGTLLEVGGTVEKSEQSNAALLAQVPLMIALMLTVLMVQLGSFRQLALVISVAPLGLIGVVAALLTTGTPMGFIAILGIIALAGMIIRNSVILVAPDRARAGAGCGSLGSGDRRDQAQVPADHADRGRGDPRHDPDHARRVLGADGLCHRRRARRRHGADTGLPPGPLCRGQRHSGEGRAGGSAAARMCLRSPMLAPTALKERQPCQRHRRLSLTAFLDRMPRCTPDQVRSRASMSTRCCSPRCSSAEIKCLTKPVTGWTFHHEHFRPGDHFRVFGAGRLRDRCSGIGRHDLVHAASPGACAAAQSGSLASRAAVRRVH